MSDKMIYRGDLMGGVTMSDREGYLQRRDQLLMQDEEIAELKTEIVELRVVLAQARKAADAAGTYTLWSCGEMSARRQVGRLKEAIKEFDALQGEGECSQK